MISSNLFFTVLALLTLGIGSEFQGILSFVHPFIRLGIGGLAYLTALFLSSKQTFFVAQGIFIGFLMFAVFVLGIQELIPTETLFSLCMLFLYFFGLRRNLSSWEPLVLNILASFPFLLLTLFSEFFPYPLGVGLALGSFFFILLLFPSLLIYFWKCPPLPSSPLKEKLLSLLAPFHFSSFHLREFRPLNKTPTAAVVGIFPKMRFILLTKALLETLTDQEILAVVTHELGHIAKKHLLNYPLVLLGMILITIKMLSFGIFIAFLVMALYFRFVFGYFSRLFEREADLFVFETALPVNDLISALDQIGKNTHSSFLPCWHHFSLHERILFLEKAAQNRTLIFAHRKKVIISIVGLWILLFLLIF